VAGALAVERARLAPAARPEPPPGTGPPVGAPTRLLRCPHCRHVLGAYAVAGLRLLMLPDGTRLLGPITSRWGNRAVSGYLGLIECDKCRFQWRPAPGSVLAGGAVGVVLDA
jgi:hypothetical protein